MRPLYWFWASTGLEGLDKILTGLQKGDNVVWQVDNVDHFRSFVDPYVKKAAKDGRQLVYMRFTDHPPLVEPGPNVTIHKLNATSGFETFSSQVHNIITEHGVGLGKTYVGLMLIERLITKERKRVALFVPKAAKDSVWERDLKRYLA